MQCYLFKWRCQLAFRCWCAIEWCGIIPFLPRFILLALRDWVLSEREHCRARSKELEDEITRTFSRS